MGSEIKIKNKNLVVLGIFRSESALDSAVNQLKQNGFRNADISALLPSENSSKEFAVTNTPKTPEGASTGAVSGLALGGTLGWLVGVGSLAIPGLGALIAAGPIMGMLAGAGVGASVGGLTGALIGLGLPEYEANRFEGQIKNGGLLLSAHCDDSHWADRAEEIFKTAGAKDVSTTSEAASDSPRDVEKRKPISLSNPV